MNIDGFVGMLTAGMLHGIRIDSELMDLPEENRVAVFAGEHLGINEPAFRRGVVVAVIRRGLAARHCEAASRTGDLRAHCPPARK